MTALAQDSLFRRWYQGFPSRQLRAAQFAASKVAYIGSLCMAVNDVAMPVLGGALLVAQATTFAGADADGGVVLRAREPGVTVQFAAGISKTLGVTSITYGATIDVLIQQGTDGAAATTNTAEQMCNLIRGNAELNKLLAVKATGTGAGLTATKAATAIACISLKGIPERRIDNSASGAAVDLLPSIVFHQGVWGMEGSTPPTLPDDMAFILDDATVTKTADPFNFRAPVVAIDGTTIYIDLTKAQ